MSTFQAPDKPGKLLSCRAAASMLGVSDQTIRRLAREHQLEAVVIGRRCIRVSEASILKLMGGKGGDA